MGHAAHPSAKAWAPGGPARVNTPSNMCTHQSLRATEETCRSARLGSWAAELPALAIKPQLERSGLLAHTQAGNAAEDAARLREALETEVHRRKEAQAAGG